LCTSCGKTIEVEKAGSINLARKLIHYSSEKILIIVKKTNKGIAFINEEIGLMYYPTNPFDCQKEFMGAIDKIVTDFYENLSLEKESENYKKKLSLIKRLEADKSNLKLVEDN
jgi:putative transposase